MDVRGNDKLLKHLREHKFARESYTKGLESLNAEYSNDFAKYQARKKNYKWGAYLTLAIMMGYVAWSFMSEFILEAFLTFLGVGVLLMLLMYFFWLRDYRRYNMFKHEYDTKKVEIDQHMVTSVELLQFAAKEVPRVICKSEFSLYQKEQETEEMYFERTFEEVKKRIEEEIGAEATDEQWVQYYHQWSKKFTSEDPTQEKRDFRSEKVAYLKKKAEEVL